MTEWFTEVKRIYDFHSKKVKELGVVKSKGRSGKVGWSVGDTAKAMVLSKGKVSEALRLYKFAQRDSTVRELPERRAAITLMKYRSG